MVEIKQKMRVSVIIPVYNKEAYIAETIESVLNQTFIDFELIILDDCSTDNSVAIIKSFSDIRIRFYQNASNMGVAFSANKLMDLCAGEYILRADADDICLPDRIEKQIKFMDENPDVDFSSASVVCFGLSDAVLNVKSKADEIKSLILFNPTIFQCSSIFRSEFIKSNTFRYNESIGNVGEDWEFWVRLMEKGKASNLDQILVKYRINSFSLSFGEQDFFLKREKALYAIFDFYQLPCNRITSHFLFKNHFPDGINLIVLKNFVGWCNYLINWNVEKKHFNHRIFEKYIRQSQLKLFYKVCDSSPWLSLRYLFMIKSFKFSNFRYLLSKLLK